VPEAFPEETAVSPTAPGRYAASFSHDWSGPRAPQGGLVAATTLRAMQAALGETDHRLRTSTTVFASTVPAGPVEIEVDVLRRGRSVSQVQGTIRAAGTPEPGHRTLAVYGRERPGYGGTRLEFTELRPPEVPPPGSCLPLPADRPEPSVFDVSFWARLEVRDVDFHYPWESGWTGGRARGVRWVRYRNTPRLPGGDLDPLAYLPLVDVIPGAVGQHLGPGAPRYFAPTLDLTVHLLDRTRSEWLLQVMRMRRAVHGYGSGEMELWDPDGRLLAHASQTMLFARPSLPAL